ncbi:Very-long-chain 3-oxoacyl-CoA synthase [Handroanthus impetiginosus]|uniref:3-ketoacyl-CoA synthase n=1 Tax=Handroanthus impetiginosus TaxID=429701 RepID=A0A2G9GIA6_9LAMI|nr:Very-long-chain 3-oxoacyl-CoA synthase [Handroanthus impetiginosus]
MAKNLNFPNAHKLPLAQMSSLFKELINFSILLAFFSLQALFILQKREPICHFLPALLLLLLTIAKQYIFSSPSPLYLVDFSCLKPPNFCRVPYSTYLEHVQMLDFLDKESVAFMSKVLTHSGQGEQTYLPPAIHYIPPKSSHQEATKEVQIALFPVLQDLLLKTKISPSEIDILIVNCSGFCPCPSLSSIIINKFSMREDIKSFTISGMGCSASALAIDMAKNILKTHNNSYAVILSTEILSTGWYPGKEQTMMVLNCLFRMGAAAILVTNKKEAKKTAKYKLLYSLRTQRAFDDKGYYSAIREEDSDGFTGVTLKRDLLQVAGETLRSNITILGSKLLPYTELMLYMISIIKKKYLNKSTEIHVPNFKRVVQHFCLPASGKPVIQEIGKGLKLGERDMEPALMTLHRFGNQSSSSLWYELAYIEAKERVKKGDGVWQLGMGSGPKCNSLVWECIRPILGEADRGAWADSIHRYPVGKSSS